MGREVIKHGNARRFGLAGNPPVEAGEIDEHDRIGPGFAKQPLGLADELEERPQEGNHLEDAHDGQVGQLAVQAAARLPHLRAAITAEHQVGTSTPQRTDQVGRMLVAARFADRKENVHRRTLTLWCEPPCPPARPEAAR